jgi:hypothetical protein
MVWLQSLSFYPLLYEDLLLSVKHMMNLLYLFYYIFRKGIIPNLKGLLYIYFAEYIF